MADRAHRIARATAIAYALCAALFGVFLSIIGVMIAGVGHFDPGFGMTVLVVPGVLFLGLSVFIWRGAIWAMIAACVLPALHWAINLGPDPWTMLAHPATYLTNIFYFAVASLFGILTVLSIATSRKSGTT